jgi:Flp pilus assembly protein TadG
MNRRAEGRNKERGYTLVFVALGLTVLLGCVGLSFDVGNLEYTQRRMQTAADAAAQSGAHEIQRGDPSGAVTAAQNDATSDGFANGTNNITVTVNNPPQTGYYVGSSTAVEAIITQSVPTLFMGLLNKKSVTVYARAVSAQVSSSNCVFALDGSASDALQATNDAQVTINCGVVVDSTSSSALYATGSAQINATGVTVVGGYSTNNNGKISPTPITGVIPMADPLAYEQAPTVGSCTYTNYPNPGSMGGQTVTLSQGTYCNGINIANGMTGKLNPGLYIISGGGLNIAGGSTVTGTGVTFYITKGNGYSFAPVVINNGTNVTFTAPTSGSYAGLLFFQDRTITTSNTSNSVTQFAGGTTMNLTGALYFPGTQLDISNGTNASDAYTIIVADTISLEGGMTFNGNYSSLNGIAPITVATLGE